MCKAITGCVCVCVSQCVYVCSLDLLLGNPNFKDPYLIAQLSGLGDYKVARVGRPATEYKIVVRFWTTTVCVCVCVCEKTPL